MSAAAEEGYRRTLEDSPLTKMCSKCGETKPVRDFPKSKRYRHGVFCWCWDCWRESHNRIPRKYKQSPRGRATVANLRFLALYGITREDVADIALRQGGKCAICESPDRNLHIDHDHESKVVRGLLCLQCNHAIGNLREDPVLFARALEYLGQ